MQYPLVSVNLVFHKDKGFFEPYLKSVREQSYQNIEINIFDGTKNNIGFWSGQEQLFKQCKGQYILCLTDVVLDKDFIKNSIAIFENHPKVGAIQARLVQNNGLIDTTGFEIFRSRKVINRGKNTKNQYPEGEIFAVEGAAPIFKRSALEQCITPAGWLIDPLYRIGPMGYGDDLDLAWRMKNLGWKQWYSPNIIGHHDRSTNLPRKQIPLIKRQLDWLNVRFTILKNDSIINLLVDAPFWITREIAVFVYSLLFEPRVLLMWPRFIRLLPKIIKTRKMLKTMQT